jgi:hypothetical protein
MLTEYDERGSYLRSIGEGLFTHPHGLRIDDADNIGTTETRYVPSKGMFWDRAASSG